MLAIISLCALILVILIGIIRPKMNLGLLAIGVAFAIGFWMMGIKEKEVASLFPASLFLMLVSMTFVFSLANENQTLQLITNRLVKLIKGKHSLLPILFFFMSFILAAAGPGNIAAVALLAPLGMVMAHQQKQSVLLMAIMICTGANSGAFSPIAPTGIITAGILHQINMNQSNLPWIIFIASAVIQSLSAVAAFILFAVIKNKKNQLVGAQANLTEQINLSEEVAIRSFDVHQKLTLICLVGLLVAIIIFKVPIVLAASLAFIPMMLINIADTETAIKKMPWDAILLVSGISLLVGLLEKSGGVALATTLIASVSQISYINALLSLITGIISAYSSSSGVVLPAFLPLVPKLIEQLGGGDSFRMAIAIAVGSHMVDVSPLSTLGAICISCAPVVGAQKNKLFRQLMIWGLSMSLVGALLSYLLLDLTY